MDLEGQPRDSPKGLDDHRAHGQIRHEVSVHHIDVDPVGSTLFRFNHLLAQPGEVGGENRRGNLHGAFFHLPRSGVGRFEDAPNGCIQQGVVLRIGLLGRQPFDQRPREARDHTVIPPQALVAFFA